MSASCIPDSTVVHLALNQFCNVHVQFNEHVLSADIHNAGANISLGGKEEDGTLDTFFDSPQGGYCLDNLGRMYGGSVIRLDSLKGEGGAKAEDCADWCISFRAPGFVGFMLGGTSDTDYCICRYSQNSVPVFKDERVFDQHNTGSGPVERGSGEYTDRVSCYPVKDYEGCQGSSAGCSSSADCCSGKCAGNEFPPSSRHTACV